MTDETSILHIPTSYRNLTIHFSILHYSTIFPWCFFFDVSFLILKKGLIYTIIIQFKYYRHKLLYPKWY